MWLVHPQRDLAIVLRAVPYEERHKVVTALTEQHGQVSAMAKNCVQSRRFGGALDPFTASAWLFTQKPGAELLQLQEAHVRRGYEGLRLNFERLAMASVFNEIMLKTAPRGEACPELFRLHSNALAALDEASNTVESSMDIALLNAYLAKLLQWSGNQPRLLACLACSTPLERVDPEESLSCVIADAGWVCSNCRAHKSTPTGDFESLFLRVAPIAIADYLRSLTLPIRQATATAVASREEHRELFAFLNALVIYHLPGFDRQPLKSLRFIELGPAVNSRSE